MSVPVTINTIATQSSAGSIAYKLIGAATTNAEVIKATVGNLNSLLICNDTLAKIYFKLYNKGTTPVVGTDPVVMTIPVAVGANQYVDVGSLYGIHLLNGISYATTAFAADSDTTSIGAGVIVNAVYK